MSPQEQNSIVNVLNLSCTGLDLTVRDDLGITPLHIASELNRVEFVRKLIHEYKIFDLNPKTNEEMLSLTPLHIATIKGNVEIVKMLLNGTNYSRVSSDELSALHYAAAFNQVAVLEELYKVYNQNQQQNQLHSSLLEFAAVNDCNQTVSTIIDKFNSTFDQIEKALHLAALYGSQNVVTILLNSLSKTDYNSKTVNGSTVLHLAAFSGNEAILERANSGPAIDLPNDSEQSALYIAFQHNNVRAAKLLIQKGANVHIRVARNRTLLHVAAIYGDYLAAKHLIEHGIEHSATDQYGRVPLHYAVSYGYLSIVHLLVQSGANPNAIDGDGFPVLHMIANLEEVSAIKILNRLLSSKSTNVNILAENGSNFTVLHLACAKGFHSIVAKLIEKGANVNAQTELAETPLHFASTFGTVADLTIAKLLLQKSANLNAKDRHGLTPIYYAVAGHGRSELIEHFIESGADLSIKSPKGETLVWTAVNRRRFNVARELIEARTDYVSPRTVDQLTPFLMACQTGDYDFVKYLSAQKGFVRSTADKSEALLLAISSKRDISVVKYLIDELQIDPTGIMDSEFGLTLFNLAVERNSTDIALYLAIEKSSAIDCLQADKSNYRPLHYAAKNGNLQLVKYLIEQKGQKDHIDDLTKEGYTPLYLAAMNGNMQIVEYLCAKGAKLKIVDQSNRSMLNAATEYNQTEIVWFLLNDKSEKVDLNLVDSRGLAPLHHAARQNNHQLVKYFALTQHSNFDLKDNRGASVLYNAIEHQGDLQMVQFLLHNQSASLEFEPENLENFVSLALQHNKHDIAEYLVRNTEVDCQTAGKSGNTPLVEAIRRHQTELVKLLIHEKGVNYGVQSDESKRTALHEAIYYEHVEAIQMLLLSKSLNSNLKAKDSNRETPIDYLVKDGVKDKSVKYFIFDFKDHKFNKTLLHIVAEMGRTSVAKLLLERGADVNAQDDLLNTPLHWAVHSGNIDTVRLLVEWIGANLTLTNHYDQTVLELAEDEDKAEIVDYLKDKTQKRIRRKRKVIIDQIDGEQQPSWWINNLIESFCIVLLFVASLYA